MFCYNTSCISPTTGTTPELFTSAFQLFAAAQCLIAPSPLPECDICDGEKYDFIVVGAGTAGCVVASRLSENENVSVLLIEAGNDAPIESRIPNLDKNMFATKYDWQYRTANDGRTNQANEDGSLNWPRGKMIGGSSNINAMLYVRGNRYDYEQWYNDGNIDWHPDVVEKYFRKLESYQYQEGLRDENISKEYGHNGPLVVNRFNFTFRTLTERIIDSWNELGIPRAKDLNLPGVFKSGISSVTAANGVRQSSDIAYIYPVKNRSNLKFLKNSLVRKVLIDENKNAYGVEVERNGKMFNLCASLEVIISAGAINSPQLLMLSGIGAKEHLRSKNINNVVDLPHVGQNLQDHCIVPVTIYGDGPSGPDEDTRDFEVIKYLYNRTGYLAQLSITDILAFYSSSQNISYPEYQNHFSVVWKNTSSVIYNSQSKLFRYKEPIPTSMAKLNENHTLYMFLFTLLHPKSRGNITLKTNDPNDYPIIYPNYFIDDYDLNLTVAGIQFLTRIVKTEYFKRVNGFLGRIDWPACDDFELDSEDYWKCISLNMVRTVYHPVGTCKMGPYPISSVVDSRLRVHGVKNLRVIDASIMPTITSGNTNGPTFMIAERGVDLVKEDYDIFI